jgi:carboxymethylenebutenolidase
MGTFIEIKAADGHAFAAYLAEPAGKPKGGLIVVQEIFGVNKHMRKVTDEYAADGYLAISPAYYDRVQRNFEVGYDPDDIKAGGAIRAQLNWDNTLADTRAALDRVKSAGKVAITGYCWGGTVAWLAASKVDGLACAIPYYGGGIPDLINDKPRVPTLCHFGELDKSPSPEKAKEVLARHPEVQAHFYPGAGHGFNCDERGSYNPEASKLARQRTLEFLKKHVG